MFFAIALPTKHREVYYDKFRELFGHEFADIDTEYVFYDSYKEAPGLLDGKQKKYDVVVFACGEAYRFTTSRLKAEIPWFYVPVTDASLYRGLLLAQRTGWDLGRLSFDTYEESVLREVYDELKYPEKKLHIKCYLANSSNPDHELNVYNFHRNHYADADGCSGCITSLSGCATLMETANVPHILAHPSLDEIRECVRNAKGWILSAMDTGSNIAVVSVDIGLPPDYIVIDDSDFGASATRLKVMEIIYRYAANVSGAVFEIGSSGYVIVTTAESIKKTSDNFRHCELLDWLTRECTNVVSIGIGSSVSASNAVRLSKSALRKCMALGKSGSVVMLDDKSIYTIEARKTSEEGKCGMISYCEKVAAKTNIGVETIARVITTLSREHTKCFTAKSLADALSISRRRASRLLECLEMAGYATTTGKEFCGKKGRPSRIVEILLNA